MEDKRVFHVTRSTKTGKTVNVGDFDTVEQAHEAHAKALQGDAEARAVLLSDFRGRAERDQRCHVSQLLHGDRQWKQAVQ